jgi:type II secretory pathway pseudopilin PulG
MRRPQVPEICDGLDNNCVNGIDEGLSFSDYYLDADGDLHGAGPAISFCSNPGAGYSLLSDDCDDTDPDTYPGAPEVLNNGTDENCDGTDNYLGIEEAIVTVFNIFPNPGNGKITISVNSAEMNANVKVQDMNGRIVYKGTLNGHESEFDLSFLENGSYLIRIESSGSCSIQRLTISK